MPSSNLPLFRGTPQKDIMFTKPTSSNPTSGKSMIYPWSSYRGTTEIPIYRHGPVSSWENLKDYATAYKRISASPSGANRIATSAVSIYDTGNTFNFLHKVRILPVVARVQWVFSHTAAAAALHVGARLVGQEVSPRGWWRTIGVSDGDMAAACGLLLDMLGLPQEEAAR